MFALLFAFTSFTCPLIRLGIALSRPWRATRLCSYMCSSLPCTIPTDSTAHVCMPLAHERFPEMSAELPLARERFPAMSADFHDHCDNFLPVYI